MKTVYKLLAALCVLALLMSLPVTAFAVGGPGPADIEALGDDTKIVMPNADSYLPEYKTMYINAPEYFCLSGYSKPEEGMQRPRGVVYHSSQVKVLAEQDGFFCVQYRTSSLNPCTAWIPERFLSEEYPGLVKNVGGELTGSPAEGNYTAYWSWEDIPNTGGKYMRLAEPCENCTGFTVDYQVTDYDVDELWKIMGPRDIYIYNGEQWQLVGSFDFDTLDPVHAVVALAEPTDVWAVRVMADCKEPEKFQTRQDVLDPYTA